MLPACDDKTLPHLHELDLAGDLNFNRQFWLEEDEILDYWASEEGKQVLDTHFSFKRSANTFDADLWAHLSQ